MILKLAHRRNLVANNDHQCSCLGTIGLIVVPCKIDFFKTSIFAIEASLLEQMYVLTASNFRGATISCYNPSNLFARARLV